MSKYNRLSFSDRVRIHEWIRKNVETYRGKNTVPEIVAICEQALNLKMSVHQFHTLAKTAGIRFPPNIEGRPRGPALRPLTPERLASLREMAAKGRAARAANVAKRRAEKAAQEALLRELAPLFRDQPPHSLRPGLVPPPQSPGLSELSTLITISSTLQAIAQTLARIEKSLQGDPSWQSESSSS